MRTLMSLQAVLFGLVVLGLGITATWRAASFQRPASTHFVDGTATKAFEKHFDEVFPVKRLGINLWAAIDYELFHEGRPGVVLGRDGWLYTDEEFNVAGDSEQTLQRNLGLIAYARDELAKRKVPLFIAVLPAKARVYPEHLAGRRPATLQGELYPRIRAAFVDSRPPPPDLLEVLVSAKSQNPTFLRTDTHWTPWGAQAAAGAIAASVRAAGLATPSPGEYTRTDAGTKLHRGDLFNFLPLDPYFESLLPPQEEIAVVRTQSAGAASSSGDDLFGGDAEPGVALIGSSYSANPSWNFVGFLQAALGEEIASYAEEGVGPFLPMLKFLHGHDLGENPPRLVIWEIPERALLVTQHLEAFDLPPVLAGPAPAR